MKKEHIPIAFERLDGMKYTIDIMMNKLKNNDASKNIVDLNIEYEMQSLGHILCWIHHKINTKFNIQPEKVERIRKDGKPYNKKGRKSKEKSK